MWHHTAVAYFENTLEPLRSTNINVIVFLTGFSLLFFYDFINSFIIFLHSFIFLVTINHTSYLYK